MALYLAVVRSQLYHCCVVWRPAAESKIERLERIKKAVKCILDEQDLHYNDWEYTCRLRDLDILPLKYSFKVKGLIIFLNIYKFKPIL